MYFKKKVVPCQAEMGRWWLHCLESGQLWRLQRPRCKDLVPFTALSPIPDVALMLPKSVLNDSLVPFLGASLCESCSDSLVTHAFPQPLARSQPALAAFTLLP